MIPYWILFSIPAWLALTIHRPVQSGSGRWNAHWKWMFFILVFMIGLRYDVGGDWINYLENIKLYTYKTFTEALTFDEPAYGLLNWIGVKYEWGVYFVNIVCAVLFSWGLIVFSRRQPRAWLAMTVAVPYLVIVVAMGYSRQGVAVGLAMLGLAALSERRLLRFALLIVLAVAFHKSAVILMPLAALASSKKKLFTFMWVALISLLLYRSFVESSIEALQINYLEAEYQSSGASVRIFMNAVPAALFLLFRRRFQLSRDEQNFWTWLSLIALGFVVLVQISPSSTAVDRVALYMIPLQLFVLSRLPEVLGSSSGKGNDGWVIAVVLYSALIQFVWLFFAIHAFAWLPYQFYPWFLLTH
jgi:hypothetical protein